MQPDLKRIMAIIDPTRTEQWALAKALALAASGADTEVIAYVCVFAHLNAKDIDELKNAEIERYQLWIDNMLAQMDTSGVSVRTQIVWDRDWREAVHHAAAHLEADLVVKRADNNTRALGNSDRRLLRTVKCNVLLVNREARSLTKRVLVAFNPRAKDDAHRELEQRVMAMGQYIQTRQPDVELHVVSAYPDSMHFIEQADLARTLEMERAHVHVNEGVAPRVIPEVAEELGTDVVIMGAMAHHGVAGFTFSHTAEKVLNALRSDVLVVTDQA